MSFHSYNDYNSGGLFLSNYATTGLGLGGLGTQAIIKKEFRVLNIFAPNCHSIMYNTYS